MNIARKIVLTGVVTFATFALGAAGAAAVAHTLTIEDRTEAVQKSSPVTTGTTIPSPSALPFDDKSVDSPLKTTVPPVDPKYVDENGDARRNGAEDASVDGHGDDSATSDSEGAGDSDAPRSLPSPGTIGSQGSGSTSGGSAESGSSSDSGSSGDSGDGGGLNATDEYR